MIRSPITNNYYTKEQLLNNFKTVYQQNELYIYGIIKFKFDETTTTKQLLVHLNSILKQYSNKITAKQKELNKKRYYIYSIACVQVTKDNKKVNTYNIKY